MGTQLSARQIDTSVSISITNTHLTPARRAFHPSAIPLIALINAPEEEDGTSITLTLTHDLYDSFSGRTPLIEVRAANKYWDRRIGKHAGTLSTAVIARAYGKGRQTQQYAVERVERMSKSELVALSELHAGWVEEQVNDHPFYYVLFLS